MVSLVYDNGLVLWILFLENLDFKTMKTIKSFLFVMFMLLASNVMANLVFEESREPGLTVTETDNCLLYTSDAADE